MTYRISRGYKKMPYSVILKTKSLFNRQKACSENGDEEGWDTCLIAICAELEYAESNYHNQRRIASIIEQNKPNEAVKRIRALGYDVIKDEKAQKDILKQRFEKRMRKSYRNRPNAKQRKKSRTKAETSTR